MKNLLNLSVVLLMMAMGDALAANCSTDCAALGYTISDASKCVSPAIKCPFDNSKIYCITTCAIGDIYYSDNSCSADYDSAKTAVGVVISIDDNKISGKIAALSEESKKMIDSSTGYYDFGCITNHEHTQSDAEQDMEGRSKTLCIINEGRSQNLSVPAANYCYGYATASTQPSNWYIPSFGEAHQALGVQRSFINTQLAKIPNAQQIATSSYLWTSSEYSDGYFTALGNGGSYAPPYKNNALPTRCIADFPLRNKIIEDISVQCSDYNESSGTWKATVFSENCSPSDELHVCVPTSLTGAGGQTCKFQASCIDDATCNQYTIIDMIPSPSNTKIHDAGIAYCTAKDGFDSLLWIDPQCSNPRKLCLRCDS